jgi:hypothetical protein
MHRRLLTLGCALALLLTPAGWAGDTPPPAQPAGRSPADGEELRLTGELRFYRHIDPVTGRGAVSIFAGGKDTPLDLRQFTLDILLRPGPYIIKGQWGKEGRLLVTEAYPAARRAAAAAATPCATATSTWYPEHPGRRRGGAGGPGGGVPEDGGP